MLSPQKGGGGAGQISWVLSVQYTLNKKNKSCCIPLKEFIIRKTNEFVAYMQSFIRICWKLIQLWPFKQEYPLVFFPTWQTFAFWRNKDKFFYSSSYFIAIMYTIVAQKVTQCFRKYKNPDKRSKNPIHHTVCLIIPSIPPIYWWKW